MINEFESIPPMSDNEKEKIFGVKINKMSIPDVIENYGDILSEQQISILCDKTPKQILSEHGIDLMNFEDGFNTQLLHSMERYSEQNILKLQFRKKLICSKIEKLKSEIQKNQEFINLFQRNNNELLNQIEIEFNEIENILNNIIKK